MQYLRAQPSVAAVLGDMTCTPATTAGGAISPRLSRREAEAEGRAGLVIATRQMRSALLAATGPQDHSSGPRQAAGWLTDPRAGRLCPRKLSVGRCAGGRQPARPIENSSAYNVQYATDSIHRAARTRHGTPCNAHRGGGGWKRTIDRDVLGDVPRLGLVLGVDRDLVRRGRDVPALALHITAPCTMRQAVMAVVSSLDRCVAVNLDLGQGVGLCRVEVGQRAELVLRDALVSEANELDNDCEQSTALPTTHSRRRCVVSTHSRDVCSEAGVVSGLPTVDGKPATSCSDVCFHLLCIRICCGCGCVMRARSVGGRYTQFLMLS